MKPAPFEYFVPDTLQEALELKAQHGDEGKALAGGQSLIPAMNFRVAQPSVLIDLNRLDDLRFIREQNSELQIGAMTLQGQAEADALVAERAPLLHEAIPQIAHSQIRNRGTIGGSLAHADPAAELPLVAIALNARMRAQSQSGERWIEARDFFAGLFATTLQQDEFLVEVAFPTMPARTGWAFMEIARRRGDYAMAGVGALLTLDENGVCKSCRLVFLNVGDVPVEASQAAESLLGKPPERKSFEEAAAIASQKEMSPFGNLHASAEYQRHLSAVLAQRALTKAYERARTWNAKSSN